MSGFTVGFLQSTDSSAFEFPNELIGVSSGPRDSESIGDGPDHFHRGAKRDAVALGDVDGFHVLARAQDCA